MTPCPICGKPVDSLRAPAVRVDAGKVVPFCSKECASAWESKPVAKLRADDVAEPPARGEAETKPAKPAKAKTPAGVVLPRNDRDVDSGPVIQIVHEPSSGVVSSSADARSGPVIATSRAETDGAIQIADTGHLDDFVSYDEPLHKSRAILWVLLALLVLAGSAAVLYSLGYFDRFLHKDSAAVTTTTKVVAAEADAAEPVDATPTITPELALDRARTLLRGQLKSDSPRVQRLAAIAYARTGDPEARTVLVTALTSETSDLAKLDVAYALARGGDPRGTEALLAGVAGGKRDRRLEAGRRLALLGDKRAIAALESYLEVSQLRLGIAEQLAYLGEPRALKALEQVRADDKAVPDEKARATVALGHAGRSEVAPVLRELLADDRQNAFAAAALANLHDEAARPVLIKQLAIPSLRVQAARGLRRLAPKAAIGELLPPLLAALDTNKDTEQVQVAEAVLLLAGPSAWSEHE